MKKMAVIFLVVLLSGCKPKTTDCPESSPCPECTPCLDNSTVPDEKSNNEDSDSNMWNPIVFTTDNQVIAVTKYNSFDVLVDSTNAEILYNADNRVVIADWDNEKYYIFDNDLGNLWEGDATQEHELAVIDGYLVNSFDNDLEVISLETLDESYFPDGSQFSGYYVLDIQQKGLVLVETTIDVYDLAGNEVKSIDVANIVGDVATTKAYIVVFRYETMTDIIAYPMDDSLSTVELSLNDSIKDYRMIDDTTFVLEFSSQEEIIILSPDGIYAHSVTEIKDVVIPSIE